MSDVIAILLGRKGSKGLPNKNRLTVLGRPISHYSLLAAYNSDYVSEIYLSTDDPDIIESSAQFSPKIINRPPELCTDQALFEDALVHGYKQAIVSRGKKPDMVVILMCNVITIDSFLVDTAVDKLEKNKEADSAVTVSCLNMYSPLRARKLSESGYLEPFVPFETFGDPETLNCDRDSQGDVYFADMSHSVSRASALDAIETGLLPQRWMGKKIIPIHNSYGCDIDQNWQVDASLSWLAERGFSETKTPYKKQNK